MVASIAASCAGVGSLLGGRTIQAVTASAMPLGSGCWAASPVSSQYRFVLIPVILASLQSLAYRIALFDAEQEKPPRPGRRRHRDGITGPPAEQRRADGRGGGDVAAAGVGLDGADDHERMLSARLVPDDHPAPDRD